MGLMKKLVDSALVAAGVGGVVTLRPKEVGLVVFCAARDFDATAGWRANFVSVNLSVNGGTKHIVTTPGVYEPGSEYDSPDHGPLPLLEPIPIDTVEDVLSVGLFNPTAGPLTYTVVATFIGLTSDELRAWCSGDYAAREAIRRNYGLPNPAHR